MPQQNQHEVGKLIAEYQPQLKSFVRNRIAVNTLLSRKHYAVLHLRKRMRQLYEDIIIA